MAITPESNTMSFFSYDVKKAVRSADAGKRTLSDWNRQIEADKKCCYFINEINLRTLRENMLKEGLCQQLEFADIDEFKRFLKEYLFKDLEDDRADLAATHAMLQWHQSGIQHATHQHTWAYALAQFPMIHLSIPIFTVRFISTKEGVCINENNTYSEWVEQLPNGDVKKHSPAENEQYCAHTSTTYLFSPDGIQLQGLSIDCPSLPLAQLFDKKSGEGCMMYLTNLFFRALQAFIASFYSGYVPVSTSEPDEPQTTFAHPRLK